MKYIKLKCSSCVDMLRLRIKFDGEPGAGFDWFEEFCAYLAVRFSKEEKYEPCVRYPRSLRIGTYREMLKIPVGKTSVVIGYGRNGKGESSEMREGYIEFNPSKTYPSEQLEYVYRLLGKEPRVSLELSRWDFATDYEIPRAGVSLLKDKRRYSFIASNGITEYLGQRNKNGFVKLYDKQAELISQGEICEKPRTRLEITIEEKPGKKVFMDEEGRETLGTEWPRVSVSTCNDENAKGGTFGVLLAAWSLGNKVEPLMVHLSKRSKQLYRKRISEEIGVMPCPTEYGDCRREAFAWETVYGGVKGGVNG